MNLSQRSKLSLCQFLTLFSRDDLVLLLGKYELARNQLEKLELLGDSLAAALKNTVLRASASQLEGLVQELARTCYSMRISVSPRRCFDDRWNDLRRCLALDGYTKERDEYDVGLDRFVPIEPSIEGAGAVEDDLTRELRRSGLPDTEGIIQVLEGSASSFRSGDFNGCLNNARVALETMAKSIAYQLPQNHPGSFDEARWGQVIAYLRTSGFITKQQEHGFTGVFGLISPGSHTPIGFNEEEFARLGRGLALSMSYFLVKQFNSTRRRSSGRGRWGC